MSIEGDLAQRRFLQDGGVLARVVAKLEAEKKEAGTLHVYREYPKMIRLSEGIKEIDIPREDVKGRNWIETVKREVFKEIIVNSEAEEESVLAGGKTSAEIEEDRQNLIRRSVAAGIKTDPTWSVVRLRRELGETLNEAPKDDLSALKEKLAQLEEMAAMKAKIAALEAQLSGGTDEAETLRSELAEAGVKVDRRWSLARLREELDRVTGG